MKAAKNILFIVLLIIYMVCVSGFMNQEEETRKVNSLKIRIADSTENRFIHTSDILDFIDRQKFKLYGVSPDEVNLEGIEKSLRSQQIIRSAEAYVTEPGTIHIEITQKEPFIRVFNRFGQGYYLDHEGSIIPLTGNYSSYVIIASGNINEPFNIRQTLNIHDVKSDSLPPSKKVIYNVFKLASFIEEDDFWKAQIEQIYVNARYEFELIPRVGSQIIELGPAEDLEEKFENLKTLYLNGFNNIGWNQYEKISLKYKNQVVCTKIH